MINFCFREMNFIRNTKKCLSVMKVLLLLPRRIGRVVDCGSLENYCTERYRGFESLILRQKLKVSVLRPFFMKRDEFKDSNRGKSRFLQAFTIYSALEFFNFPATIRKVLMSVNVSRFWFLGQCYFVINSFLNSR